MRDNQKIKVCAYCRVSTDSNDQLNSLENQKEYFIDIINKNKDWEFTGIYADEGITGTSLSKREQVHKMLYDSGVDIKEVENKKMIEELRIKNIIILYQIESRSLI